MDIHPIFLYIHATISAALLQSYKIALHIYITYPTFSSCVVTIATFYLFYKLTKYIVSFVISSLVAFIRVMIISLLLLVGVWCYLRGPDKFLWDLKMLWGYIHQMSQNYVEDRDILLDDLRHDMPQQTFDIKGILNGASFGDLQQLVSTFGFGIANFYGTVSRNMYKIATSEAVKRHYDALYKEYNDMYREL